MSDSGRIVGAIEPNPEGGEPLFTIVRRGDTPPPNVRACPHPRYLLDEEWSTVTCGRCGERLDPFAVLLNYAVWWQRFDNHRAVVEQAERRLHIAELR